jgi:ribosomal protein S18 acetylase RimI-like enzyme
MPIKIIEEPITALPEYGKVSIAFLVSCRLQVEPVAGGLGGFKLIEEKVEPPYVKDYDQNRDEGPTRWMKQWDISNWGVLSAFDETQRVGGAVVAWNTPGVHMLEERVDLAALWDIRVDPGYRARGVGSQLFAQAVEWSRRHGCRLLKIETQNNNTGACRFYAKQGCTLGGILRWAYPDLPEEVQMLWYKTL